MVSKKKTLRTKYDGENVRVAVAKYHLMMSYKLMAVAVSTVYSL